MIAGPASYDMNQVRKFYLASFLKNQVYFVPVIVLFFQDLGLSYSQIFWIFTIGAAFSFIIEIPTGIFADLYGQRRSIIISKFLIFISFIFFGFSGNFVALLIANLIYELGKSFRSGTETAYVVNYLNEQKDRHSKNSEEKYRLPSYTKIKINQKFYARISESLAAIFGGFIAYRFGFSWVFFVAALPALINWLQTLGWAKLEGEGDQKGQSMSIASNWLFLKDSFRELRGKKVVSMIIINISIFGAALAALDKFVQPYMKSAGIELQHFGLIYSLFLIIIAFLVKFAAKLEDKVGGEKIMNYSNLFALVPLVVLASGAPTIWSVALFFVVLMIDNLRSPVANNLFHEQVSAAKRATMGSILELFESLNKLWILPLIGYAADILSINTAILIIGALISINLLFFSIKGAKEEKLV